MKSKVTKLLNEQKGIIDLKAVLELGMSKAGFYSYARDNALIRVGHGVYASKEAWIDPLYLLHLRSKQVVFSHETALYLNGMTDREPIHYSVTVKRGYNPSRLGTDGIVVYTVKEELHELGLTQIKTSFDHLVPVYNVERTLCDIVKNRNKMDMQSFQDALKAYSLKKEKNLRRLMQYAKSFRLENVLKPYLEVLL